MTSRNELMVDRDRTAARRRRRWLGLLAAIVFPSIATVLSAVFLPYIGQTQFLFFFPSVAAAAWLGGLPAGLLATVLAIGLADYFIIPPHHSLLLPAPADAVRLALFAAFAVIISRLSDTLNRARDKAEALAVSLSDREHHLKEQLDAGMTLTAELEETNEKLQSANVELQRTQLRR